MHLICPEKVDFPRCNNGDVDKQVRMTTDPPPLDNVIEAM